MSDSQDARFIILTEVEWDIELQRPPKTIVRADSIQIIDEATLVVPTGADGQTEMITGARICCGNGSAPFHFAVRESAQRVAQMIADSLDYVTMTPHTSRKPWTSLFPPKPEPVPVVGSSDPDDAEDDS